MKKYLIVIAMISACLCLTACDEIETNKSQEPDKPVTTQVEVTDKETSGESTVLLSGESNVEQNKTELANTEVPVTGAPTTGAPTTGAPTTGAPTTGAPTTEVPATTKAPTSEAPATEIPATEQPQKTESSKKSEYTVIKFSDMYEVKGTNKNVSTMLKNLNGKKVQIKGYPASYSPLDESFIYLNNQPFVTCPFCTIGDTTKLEVIPIFMANKSKIKYTENAINVTGTLEVAEKKDSEGYTTQFRIYADKVEEIKDDNSNKEVIEYYKNLTQAGMIYDIQTLQMNIEYVSNPQYMTYYGKDKKEAVNNMIAEFLGFDEQYGGSYLTYVKECPDIVKACEPQGNEKLIKLNNELIELYNKEIVLLEKWQNIIYKYKDATVDDKAANDVYNTLLTPSPSATSSAPTCSTC